jgi:SAM-dependent methyltransferase
MGKRIIEVGAININGSLRENIESLQPMSYLGVDIADGNGVDEICDVTNLIKRFGKESFDVVVCTEVLEHVRDWRKAISNLKNILKPNGILLLTTRSRPFPYHGNPFDFWRYEIDDMQVIFSDLSAETIEKDPLSPGVFVKAHKPVDFSERNLEAHELYSIVRDKYCRNISGFEILTLKTRRWVLQKLPDVLILKPRHWVSRILPTQVKAGIRKLVSREIRL